MLAPGQEEGSSQAGKVLQRAHHTYTRRTEEKDTEII